MIENFKDQQIIDELIEVASQIRSNYHELHKQLADFALFVDDCKKDEITISDLEKHLEKLKNHLRKLTETPSFSKDSVLEMV